MIGNGRRRGYWLVTPAAAARFLLATAICFPLRTLLCAVLLVSREPAVIAGAALLFGVTFWVIAPLTVVFGREIAA